MSNCEIGLIGLAVMGQNLVLNMERHGYRVAVYNRTSSKTQQFIEGPAAGKHISPAYSFENFVDSLQRPLKIMIMVKAGEAVDAIIAQLMPYLEPGDLLIDGGNSHFRDTERRSLELEESGIRFLGVGISGGEEGALWGPSIMPGGQRQGFELVEDVFRAIAAKVNGEPCVTYIGPRGSGHYVKMVHNGIEYGVMQLIAEVYDLLKRGAGLSAEKLSRIFQDWNQGDLASFLIEITAIILARIDEGSGQPLVELILDKAEQKGTGKWTSMEALELGVPVTVINAGVEARLISALKEERMALAQVLSGMDPETLQAGLPDQGNLDNFIRSVGEALFASQLIVYIQGFQLLSAASREYDYQLDLEDIARIWRGGCIIRAGMLEHIRSAYAADSGLVNLLHAPFLQGALRHRQEAWRQVLKTAIGLGIPAPAMCASLAAYDSYRSPRLPANLIQAQRDFFGAHTYERIDREGNFHTQWDH